MESLLAEIDDVVRSIESTTDYFYQQKAEQGYQELVCLLDKLEQTVNKILKYKEEHTDAKIDEAELNTILRESVTAMEQNDVILLSDILKYDLTERLMEVKLSIGMV